MALPLEPGWRRGYGCVFDSFRSTSIFLTLPVQSIIQLYEGISDERNFLSEIEETRVNNASSALSMGIKAFNDSRDLMKTNLTLCQ